MTTRKTPDFSRREFVRRVQAHGMKFAPFGYVEVTPTLSVYRHNAGPRLRDQLAYLLAEKEQDEKAKRFLPLTASERDLLRHRLDADDAITEVLLDDSYERPYPEEATKPIEVAIALVRLFCETGAITLPLDGLPADVLVECVEGSTWAASATCSMDGEPTHQRVSAANRIGTELARKISAALHRPVNFPTA